MSTRGAAGMLERAGKTPKKAGKLDLTPKDDVQEKSEPPPKRVAITDSEASERVAEAKKAATQEEKPSKAGQAVGQSVGKTIGSGISYANEGAGFVLGLLVWGWLVRPYLKGGTPLVKAVLMAKFFNKDPKGKELP